MPHLDDHNEQLHTPSLRTMRELPRERHAEINALGFCPECLRNEVLVQLIRTSSTTATCGGCGKTYQQ